MLGIHQNKRSTTRPPWPYSINLASPQAKGLTSWWPGDVAGGPLLFDLNRRYPYLANGTLSNGATWEGSEFGLVPFLDGSNDYIDCPGVQQMATGSISCWFLALSLPGLTERDIILTFVESSEADSLPPTTHDKTFFLNSSGIVKGTIYSGQSEIVACVTAITTNVWFHLALTIANGIERIYLNGKEEASLSFVGESYTGYAAPALRMAGAMDTVNDLELSISRLNGRICDVRLYERVLLPSEVWSLYDPASRWELYNHRGPSWIVQEQAAAAAGGFKPYYDRGTVYRGAGVRC